MNNKQKIALIQEVLHLDPAEIRAIGVSQCMTQVFALKQNMDVLRCDADSGMTGQDTRDLEKDLKLRRNERVG